MATVNIVEVNKLYDNHVILKNVNLRINKGEFVAVVGPSGSGKSTLLRMVAGLEEVTSGSILINHQCVNKIPADKRNMAMVFQNYALYPHMTAFDNMAYGLKIRGMKKNLIEERVMAVAVMLQLSDYLYRKPTSLSGGQRQRVAMGRAIVRSPAVFLFDEPLSNLDSTLRLEMRQEIKKLHQQLRTTSLYVTHDQTEAMTLADKIVILNKGTIEQVGTPHDVYQFPATVFVASFIGYYPMNFIKATIDLRTNKILTDIGIELPIPLLDKQVSAGDAVFIGIRPEHLKINAEPDIHSFDSHVEFIDDMGADKIVQVITERGKVPLAVRVFDDDQLNKKQISLQIKLKKANLFCQQTGIRLGGWHDE